MASPAFTCFFEVDFQTTYIDGSSVQLPHASVEQLASGPKTTLFAAATESSTIHSPLSQGFFTLFCIRPQPVGLYPFGVRYQLSCISDIYITMYN